MSPMVQRATQLQIHQKMIFDPRFPPSEQKSTPIHYEPSHKSHSPTSTCHRCKLLYCLSSQSWHVLITRMSQTAHRVTFSSRRKPAPERPSRSSFPPSKLELERSTRQAS